MRDAATKSILFDFRDRVLTRPNAVYEDFSNCILLHKIK